MKSIKPKRLKGFRDFLPKQMIIRQRVFDIIKKIFESYGFSSIETPALEYAEILLGKYGPEADRLIYCFKDRGERNIALRYDLTIPLARVMAQNIELVKPFKRYQIQPVWRAESPQKSRYREFTQCDIDIVGTDSPLADAEIIFIIQTVLKRLGFEKFTILINSRQILYSIIKNTGIKNEQIVSIIRSIDKLDKICFKGVKEELIKKGIDLRTIKKIFTLINKAKPDPFLKQVLKLSKKLGVEKRFIKFSPSLSRGLDYYTGPIYEAVIEKPKIGSIVGGGRYDKLLSIFLNKHISACGVSFGIDRIIDAIEELSLLKRTPLTKTQVLITIFNNSDKRFLNYAIDFSKKLREENIDTEIYLDLSARLDKQLRYADRKGIPYAVIFGPDEIKKETLIIKDFKKRKQREIKRSRLAHELKLAIRSS